MTKLEIKLLILYVFRDIIDKNIDRKDEDGDIETKLWRVVTELENQYKNEG